LGLVVVQVQKHGCTSDVTVHHRAAERCNTLLRSPTAAATAPAATIATITTAAPTATAAGNQSERTRTGKGTYNKLVFIHCHRPNPKFAVEKMALRATHGKQFLLKNFN
jgi:hypothetical protein